MRDYIWKRVSPEDRRALEAFLRSREPEAAGFISRLWRNGNLRLPSPFHGSLHLAYESGAEREEAGVAVHGAVFRTTTGIVFPLLPADASEKSDRGLPRGIGDGIASIVGPAGDVERFEAAQALKPLVTVAYDLMARSTGIALPPLAVPAGFETRRAGVEDEAALYPLQAAYEQEEVLTAIHRFDEAGCRAGLAKALREQVVLLGSLDGFIIAKAATNARAFGLDQLGGIYVAPPYRRRGIGAALVGRLVGTLAAEGRGAVLFVKSRNEAARHLYDGLGFHFAGPYRADYLVSGL